MSIQKDIEELERELELKKAYIDVKISFSKGSKFSQEVTKAVQDSLKECALNLASGVNVFDKSFSSEEVLILKSIAEKVLSAKPVKPAEEPKDLKVKTPTSSFPPDTNAPTIPVKDAGPIGKVGELIMLDAVPYNIRNQVEPASKVRILDQKDVRLFVEDNKGQQFWVNSEDIEIVS